MSMFNLKTAALAIAAGVGLSGCAYGPYGGLGVGVGYGNDYYDPYYGSRYYGSGYSPYGYGYGYGSPYYGWNNGYYYPGSGYYVYDRYRRPYRWTDTQRRYWQWRQRGSQPSSSPVGRVIENWADFQNGPQASTNVVRQRDVTSNRTFRGHPAVTEQRAQTVQHQERRAARAEAREERRTNRGERRRANHD